MELHQLEYFLAVAKYNSFTKAAEETNISQSSLSIQISKLESELKVRLFERSTRSIFLTNAGKEFRLFADRIISEIMLAKNTMEQFVSADSGTIRIGDFPGSRYFGFIDLVSKFKKKFPNITFDMYEAECSELLSMLKTSEIDVAFLTHYHALENIHFYPLYEDYLILVVRKDHPLADREYVSLTELKSEQFIFNIKTTLYTEVNEAFRQLNIKPNIAVRTKGSLSSTLGFVDSGLGVTLVSSCVKPFFADWGFSYINVEPTIKRQTYLAVPNTQDRLPIISNFTKFIREHYTSF